VNEEGLPWDTHLLSALTPRRLELLGYVTREHMDSINDLARRARQQFLNS
jgi:predicted transcriptional regulator